MIGGTDIVIPAYGDTVALDDCVRTVQFYWPDARFEDAVEAKKYRIYADIPFGQIEELFIYRDGVAEAAWDADNANSPLNSMLYLLVSPDSVTVVVDEPSAADIGAILESIKQALRFNCVYGVAA